MSVSPGLPKLVWFHRLKKSAVKRSSWRSEILKYLISEASQFCWNGPRYRLRPRFPKPVAQKSGLLTGSQVVVGLFGSDGYNNGAGINAVGLRYPLMRW